MREWDQFVAKQAQELGSDIAEKWLGSLKVLRFDARNLYLEARDVFHTAWFEEQMRYKVRKLLKNGNGKPITVHLSLGTSKPAKKEYKPPLELVSDACDPHATLDSFYQGKSNEAALQLLAAALQKPATYNPLYLCGPTGSGKSHLLMAATEALRSQGLNPLFVRAETLTFHVVAAIRSGLMRLFRDFYRSHDALIVDDVQVLAQKTATQEEFFHTFNAFHSAGKQIILAGPCVPSQLEGIEPRLTSRFEWGLVLPLQTPTPAELLQILDQRQKLLDFSLPENLRQFLLTHFSSSAKSLLRAFDSLVLYAHMQKKTPSQIDPLRALTSLLEEEKRNLLTSDKIVYAVGRVLQVPSSEIFSKSQKKDVCFARKIAMHLCREMLKMPYTKIGKEFNRDHSSVITNIRFVQKELMDRDSSLKTQLGQIVRLTTLAKD
ncbi:MAG: ATP-binding protein [Verrucomicrobia bacterium]|nr:ATP-binding protein [Verrucomicrobiota bacterium]